jgi:hypothetical protein
MPFPPGVEYSWAEFNRRRYWCWGIGLTFAPAVVKAMWVDPILKTDIWTPTVGIVWMLAWMMAIMRRRAFPCPRCQRAFFGGILMYNDFARKCTHCHLKKYAKDDASMV